MPVYVPSSGFSFIDLHSKHQALKDKYSVLKDECNEYKHKVEKLELQMDFSFLSSEESDFSPTSEHDTDVVAMEALSAMQNGPVDDNEHDEGQSDIIIRSRNAALQKQNARLCRKLRALQRDQSPVARRRIHCDRSNSCLCDTQSQTIEKPVEEVEAGATQDDPKTSQKSAAPKKERKPLFKFGWGFMFQRALYNL